MSAPVASELGPAVDQALRVGDAARRVSEAGTGEIVIVVPDVTRELDYEAVVRPISRILTEQGRVARIFVGLGMHRPMRPEELEPLLRIGRELGWAVDQHDPHRDLVELAADVGLLPERGTRALPACFAAVVARAGLRILVGTVEPHQYAGFSGGLKAVAIGCASRETISVMHGLELLRQAGTRLGSIDDNPFAAAVRRLGRTLGPTLGLQIVPDGRGRCFFAGFGAIEEVFEQAARVCRQTAFVGVDRTFPWVHVPVAGEKAKSFYQASRYATYLALADRPVVEADGLIVLEAGCSEGVGQGEGERTFVEAMARGLDALRLELEKGFGPSGGGAQRAYVLARALARARIALVSAHEVAGIDAIGIRRFDRLEDALRAHGCAPGEGARFADVLHRVPVLRDQSSQS